ncbi:OmpH family outer membrane protein [Coprobacter tertius]|uniref:OmpH family outer membrane protein n=1 Tax=Coprobacter tertius TaxID=2944915 RepID=A0ABT1MG54_9BACT|nr:OmpH family outer membrane protein [Coprobacter tertius]MCP9611602.1 OmpH family outer membrane protein [Coprobacter tertius]
MKIATHLMHSAVAVAVVLSFAQCKQEKAADDKAETTANVEKVASNGLSVAYINVDSVLQKYEYAKFLNERLIRKAEDARASFNEKARDLQRDGEDFQRKYKNNAFLSQERFEQEQQRLAKKQNDLQALGERLEKENIQEQQNMLSQMNDSIMTFIKEYNQTKKYDVILNNLSTLYINPSFDITNEVIVMLNKRYNAAKK